MRIVRELDMPLPPALQVDFYAAPTPIELISTIPAPNYTTNSQRAFRRVAHLLIPDVQPGDVLDVDSCFEITNDITDNANDLVEFSAGLILTPASSGTAGLETMTSLSTSSEPSNGKFMTRFPGYNLTENEKMHHGMMPLSTKYLVPAGVSGDQYVAIMCYVAGTDSAPTSDFVTVEPYAGWLRVERRR